MSADRTDKRAFWEELYKNQDTGWDLGEVSPPLKDFFDRLPDRSLSILIPGGGRSHEAEYLHLRGFTNVHVLDFSASAIQEFLIRAHDFPVERAHNQDFFIHKGQYDLIIEQTFFCALEKNRRAEYVAQMHDLLTEEGSLAGLLFNVPKNQDHPPYGGSEEEYRSLFSKKFSQISFEPVINSAKGREGTEIFFHVRK